MHKFEGLYFKHQGKDATVCFVVGVAQDNAFVQMITKEASEQFVYPRSEYKRRNNTVALGENLFSEHGVLLCLQNETTTVNGKIRYGSRTPIHGDIMGPLQHLPLPCKHEIISMHHALFGEITINGKALSFTGGSGYIEGDYGVSFPRAYTWLHCQEQQSSAVFSVALLPVGTLNIEGCFAVVHTQGREYRLASYLGARVLQNDGKHFELAQGKLRLHAEVLQTKPNTLAAPQCGAMERKIQESAECTARVQFFCSENLLLDITTTRASYEFEL